MYVFSVKYDQDKNPNTRVIVQEKEDEVQIGHYHLPGLTNPHWKYLLQQLIDSEQVEAVNE